VKSKKHVDCLVGSTNIVTDTGVYPIADLYDRLFPETIHQFGTYGCRAEVRGARPAKETVLVKFNIVKDTLEGSPDQEFMMLDGSFKKLADLVPGDVLAETYYHLGVVVASVETKHHSPKVSMYTVANMLPTHTYIVQLGFYRIVAHNNTDLE